jgi:hypothetical protein
MYTKRPKQNPPTLLNHGERRPSDLPDPSPLMKAITMFVLLLLLTSCAVLSSASLQGKGPEWQSFAADVPVSEWNRSLEVTIPQSPRFIGAAFVVDALLMNRSQKEISFPPDYGARAFIYSVAEDSWSEVENNMRYRGGVDILVPKSGPDSNWAALVTIIPDISNAAEGDLLRIVLVGDVVSGGATADERVGAYVDFELPR